MDPSDIQKLVKKSRDAMAFAYCPYSKFPVGAALLTEDGKVITGCNVENVSYGLTVCAERTAIFKAVTEGYTEFKAMAISTDLPDAWSSPCGACRQVLLEFGTDYELYLSKPDMTYITTTPAKLLANGFSPKLLKEHQAQIKENVKGPHTG